MTGDDQTPDVGRAPEDDAAHASEAPKRLPVRLPRPWLERLLVLVTAFIPVTWLLRDVVGTPAVALPFVGALLTGWRVFHHNRTEAGEVRVAGGVLHVRRAGQERAVPLSSIAHAEIVHRPGGVGLRLEDARRAVLVELAVGSLGEAEQWIARLGLSLTARELAGDQQRPSMGEIEAAAYAALLMALALATGSMGPAAATSGLLLRLLMRRRIRVGIDGIEEHQLGRRRFHPFARIRDVVRRPDGISLQMDDGSVVALEVSKDLSAEAKRADVFATISRAREAYRQSTSSDAAADLLARKDRTIAEWTTALAAVEKGSAYRDGALSKERLAQVLNDPHVDPTSRTGAAWLLARAGETEVVRRARHDAAQTKVRVALDAALGTDAVALDVATAELTKARRSR